MTSTRTKSLLTTLLTAGFLLATISPQALAQAGKPTTYLAPSPDIDLDLIQSAWQGDPKSSDGQQQPGYRQFVQSWDTIHRIQMRPSFVTILRFDPTETIREFILGDPSSFEAARNPSTPNTLQVRPLKVGVDGSLSVTATTGTIYSFVLISLPTDHPTTTDLLVDILKYKVEPESLSPHKPEGPHPSILEQVNHAKRLQSDGSATTHAGTQTRPISRIFQSPNQDANYQNPQVETSGLLAGLDLQSYNIGPNATLLHRPASDADTQAWGNLPFRAFDPSKFRYNIDAFATSWEAADAIGPVRAYHDDYSTIIDFGEEFASKILPQPNLLTNGTEQPISFRTAGEGRYLVVHAVGRYCTSQWRAYHLSHSAEAQDH